MSVPLRPPGLSHLDRLHTGGQILFKKDDGVPDAPTPPVQQPPNPLAGIEGLNLPVQVLQALTRQAEGSGGWQAYAVALADQNQKLRTKLREASDAPSGALIITDEAEKEVISSLKGKLGSIKAIGERVALADKMESDAATRTRTDALAAAATAAGLKGKVLAQLPGMDQVEAEVRKVGDKETAFVKIKKGEGTNATTETVELSAYVKERWPDLMGALIDTPAEGQEGGEQQAATDQSGQGYNAGQQQFNVAAPPANQGGGGGQKGGGKVDLLGSVLGPINDANATKVSK